MFRFYDSFYKKLPKTMWGKFKTNFKGKKEEKEAENDDEEDEDEDTL